MLLCKQTVSNTVKEQHCTSNQSTNTKTHKKVQKIVEKQTSACSKIRGISSHEFWGKRKENSWKDEENTDKAATETLFLFVDRFEIDIWIPD